MGTPAGDISDDENDYIAADAALIYVVDSRRTRNYHPDNYSNFVIRLLSGAFNPVIKSEVDGFGFFIRNQKKLLKNKLHVRHGGMINLIKPVSIGAETRLNHHSPRLLPRGSQPVQGTDITLIKLPSSSDPFRKVRCDPGRRHGLW